jgi:hypothetical protein
MLKKASLLTVIANNCIQLNRSGLRREDGTHSTSYRGLGLLPHMKTSCALPPPSCYLEGIEISFDIAIPMIRGVDTGERRLLGYGAAILATSAVTIHS